AGVVWVVSVVGVASVVVAWVVVVVSVVVVSDGVVSVVVAAVVVSALLLPPPQPAASSATPATAHASTTRNLRFMRRSPSSRKTETRPYGMARTPATPLAGEQGDRLDVWRVREHVDRTHPLEGVAPRLLQRLDVAGERRRIAGDVDEPGGL